MQIAATISVLSGAPVKQGTREVVSAVLTLMNVQLTQIIVILMQPVQTRYQVSFVRNVYCAVVLCTIIVSDATVILPIDNFICKKYSFYIQTKSKSFNPWRFLLI